MKELELIDRLQDDSYSLCTNAWREHPENLPGKDEYFAQLDTVNESYEVFISFFKEHTPLRSADVLLAANFIYAWKSEKFVRGTTSLKDATKILNRARIKASRGKMITVQEFRVLVGITKERCESMATKLLHLAVPEMYGILDKHVYRYLANDDWDNALKVHGLSRCFDYWRLLRSLVTDNDVSQIHQDVQNWLGYKVTEVRALELVMYVRGKLTSLRMEAAAKAVESPARIKTKVNGSAIPVAKKMKRVDLAPSKVVPDEQVETGLVETELSIASFSKSNPILVDPGDNYRTFILQHSF